MSAFSPCIRRLAVVAVSTVLLSALSVLLSPPSPVAASESESGVLTSRPLAAPKPAPPLPVGRELNTARGERRRLSLGDGCVLYVNEQTRVKRSGARRLTLTSGGVFVDVAPGRREEDFVVETPRRELTTRAGRFAAYTIKDGTTVIVASGSVRVNGVEEPLRGGQQLLDNRKEATPAERVSHRTEWTRDLMTESESPLVPQSQYAGGRLVVRDPDGQQAQLSLRKYHIDVHVENGFARTTIDQTYFNHTPARLEGTFYFPLPPDASLSRLAMYVDGRLMEGGMAERDYARRVFEQVIYQQKDPALLEWLDGSTFKMRVFPLEPRQEKRLLLSYTQKLPSLYGQVSYRSPTGHDLGDVRDWSFHARLKNGGGTSWHSSSHALQSRKEGTDLVLDVRAKNSQPRRDVVLTFGGGLESNATVSFSAAEHEGAKYLMVRCEPALPSQPQRQRRDWVFLFESSGDRDPLLARTQVEIVRGLLANAEADDTFAVLTANTRVRAWKPEAQPVAPENVRAAIGFLESSHLIGALDLAQALDKTRPFLEAARHPYLVHIGSGIAAMGERRDNVLAQRIPPGTHYVGVGVGKRWNRAGMKEAAERTDGYFTQINPDETLSWRTFDLAATLNTPRLLNVSVADREGRAMFLPFARSLAQGEEIAAIARIDKDMPQAVVIRGTLNDKPFEKELAVREVAEKADYLPRSWAKLEIERLLAEDAVKHKERIIALSKAMYVMTPFTSLLVLENEEMYQQYKVDRGRKDHWAMYPCPEKIEVVYEPEDGQPGDPKKGIKPSAQQVRKTILLRDAPHVFRQSEEEVRYRYIRLERLKALSDARAISENLVEAAELDNDAALRKKTEESRPMIFFQDGLAIEEPRDKMFLEAMNDAEAKRVQQPAADDAIRLEPPGIERMALSLDPNERMEAFLRNRLSPIVRGMGTTLLGANTVNAVKLAAGSFETDSFAVTGVSVIPEKMPQMLAEENSQHTLLYQRPSYSGDDRLFFDLVAYAPGLNTTTADIQGVIEAEAAPRKVGKTGTISDIARHLLDKARSTGWQSYTVAAADGQAEYTITFDGRGRYVRERRLPIGMRERVVCDGATLWHIYPDLGLAARRTVSRFHRREAGREIPWILSAEDLAHDADLVAAGERAIAVLPHARFAEGKARPHIQTNYVFDSDYRLAERQFLEMPAGKLLYRETYADGAIKSFDGEGKELAVVKGALRQASAPDLSPDTRDLVVLSLPYRTRDRVLKTRKIENKDYAQLRFEDGLALLAADFAAGNGEVVNVFQRCFAGRDQHQIGLYVLLAACGQNLDSEHLDVLARHPHDPLAQYLALHSSAVLRKHASQWAVGSNPWGEGFLQRLAMAHALLQRWQNGRSVGGSDAQQGAERERALAYVRANKGSGFAWALLGLMQDRARDDEANKKDTRDSHRALAEAWPLFADVASLSYAARYEEARGLYKCGQVAEARKRFRALYERTVKEGRLPPLDGDLRAALVDGGEWGDLLRRTAADFIERKHRSAVLILATQCWQVGDPPLADHLLTLALENLPNGEERLPVRLAGLSFLWRTGQLARADAMLRLLLADPKAPHRADLWRLAAKLAQRRDMPARRLECLEQALALEYQHLPEILDLRQTRQEYAELLGHYQQQAQAMVSLKVSEPADFRAKVVRAADRWRALDSDGSEACGLAARILQTLGERDLMWDYLTTPIAGRPNEAEPWARLARSLNQQGEPTLADRAYQAAFEAEPTDAQLLWDRAGNLRQSGQLVGARELYRRLADGDWPPRFRWLQTQARWELDRR